MQKIPLVIASEGWRLGFLGLQMADSQSPKLEGTFLKSNLGVTILDPGLTIRGPGGNF